MKQLQQKKMVRLVSIILAILMVIGVLATSIPALMGF